MGAADITTPSRANAIPALLGVVRNLVGITRYHAVRGHASRSVSIATISYFEDYSGTRAGVVEATRRSGRARE